MAMSSPIPEKNLDRIFAYLQTFTGVIVVSSLLGFLYGTLVTPLWMENVEFAAVLSGYIHFDVGNPWFYQIVSRLTLLTAIPAFFLKMGVSTWALSVVSTGIQCAVTFCSISVCAFLLSGSGVFALLILPLLSGYEFGVAHYYPVIFPLFYFSFGLFGMFYALLCLSIYTLYPKGRVGLLIGLFPGLHVGWAVIVWLAIAADIFLERKTQKLSASFYRSFCLGLLIVIIGFAGVRFIKAHLPENGPLRDQRVTMEEFHKQVDIIDQRDENGFPGSHNMLVREAPDVPKEIAKYFFSELAVLLFAFISFRLLKDWRKEPVHKFLRMVLIIMGATLISRVFEETDRHFMLFASILPTMPSYLHQLITNRWFNLDTLILPLLSLSLIGYFALTKKSALAALLLGPILFLGSSGVSWSLFPFAYNWLQVRSYGITLWLITLGLAALFANRRAIQVRESIDQWLNRVMNRKIIFSYTVTTIFLALCLISGICKPAKAMLRTVVKTKPFLGHDRFDEITTEIRKTPGSIVLVHGLKSIDGFNPQLRLERAVILPESSVLISPLMPFTEPAKIDLKVYCIDMFDPHMRFKEAERIKACLENKTLAEWQSIRAEYGATSVLLPDTWTVHLPLDMKSAGMAYFQIPAP